MLYFEVCVCRKFDFLNGNFCRDASPRQKLPLRKSNSLQDTDVNKQHVACRHKIQRTLLKRTTGKLRV